MGEGKKRRQNDLEKKKGDGVLRGLWIIFSTSVLMHFDVLS